MKSFIKNSELYSNKLEEFSEEIGEISAATRNSLEQEFEDIMHQNIHKFRNLLVKELVHALTSNAKTNYTACISKKWGQSLFHSLLKMAVMHL